MPMCPLTFGEKFFRKFPVVSEEQVGYMQDIQNFLWGLPMWLGG